MKKNNRKSSAKNGSHSGVLFKLESGFSCRLKQAIGKRSVHSFAKSCGISDSLIRKYLAGSLPGLDKALILAREAGVSLEWLATGQALPEKSESATDKKLLDVDLMEEVIAKTRRKFRDQNISMTPEDEAKIIRLIYEFNSEITPCLDGAPVIDNASAFEIRFSQFDLKNKGTSDLEDN
ncbi:helix-turn-helix domain-containing protein [Pseudidiomarina sp. 1APP75-32.1]|uniref:Helix-turn-helix domain-containing protein n=1 Tax=Pseudidiomarina terrestris TaxID=2820060 RepID=A0AAW7QYB7_9GAMM|nr:MULTISPECIES: helix-turn-helix domain-containing protein [unclassified Pseudidiomarina]MDN7124858.1 helix-turn-helix domain-containing protein [Pseudidiomarina sp. 1APP75-32.1]MDN7129668.1 helix-turn-helix domain-containing protein [Pseudidiomarina sp. 1APR75-15]